MTTTYDCIATTTLANSTTTSVTFSSIPSTFTDLVLILQGRGTFAQNGIDYTFHLNGDTGSNYSLTWLQGNGTSATSGRLSNFSRGYWTSMPAANDTSGVFSANIVNFLNYANTTTFKTVIGRSNSPTNSTAAIAGLWRSTSAINSIKIMVSNEAQGFFVSGSTFTLYGIKAE